MCMMMTMLRFMVNDGKAGSGRALQECTHTSAARTVVVAVDTAKPVGVGGLCTIGGGQDAAQLASCQVVLPHCVNLPLDSKREKTCRKA